MLLKVDRITLKASKRLHILRVVNRNVVACSTQLLKVYIALVRLVLEYCVRFGTR